jgi:hypothetical protein
VSLIVGLQQRLLPLVLVLVLVHILVARARARLGPTGPARNRVCHRADKRQNVPLMLNGNEDAHSDEDEDDR